jgi:hypothetical protein
MGMIVREDDESSHGDLAARSALSVEKRDRHLQMN